MISNRERIQRRPRTLREAVSEELDKSTSESDKALSARVKPRDTVIGKSMAQEIVLALGRSDTNREKARALSERIHFHYFQADSKWLMWTKRIGLIGATAIASTLATHYFTGSGTARVTEQPVPEHTPSPDAETPSPTPATPAPVSRLPDWSTVTGIGGLGVGAVGVGTGLYSASNAAKNAKLAQFWDSRFDSVPVTPAA